MAVVAPLGSLAVEQLQSLVLLNSRFFVSARAQVEEMNTELMRLRTFLIDANRRQVEGDDSVANLVVQIQEVVYDGEEVIATFIAKAAAKEASSVSGRSTPVFFAFKRCLHFFKTSRGRTLIRVGLQIQEINRKIVMLTRRLEANGVRQQLELLNVPRIAYAKVVEESLINIQDNVRNVIYFLKDETHCRVFCIQGMSGTGKTTLAKEIHRHREIKHYFNHVAWVRVSEECNPHQVWRDILLQFAHQSEEAKRIYSKMTSNELAGKLRSFQMEKKCLVTLDDIRSSEDWNNLLPAFPRSTETASKILLTTRNRSVSQDDVFCFYYELPLLSNQTCLDLLEYRATRYAKEFELTSRMNNSLKGIVLCCGGRVSAVVLAGGLLAKDNTSERWEYVCQNLSSSSLNGRLEMKDLLAFCYQDLPSHLKACFLYLSLFPEGHEIDAKSLAQMWVAEGFVSSNDVRGEGRQTMLDVGLSYFDDLVNRSMVQANITWFSNRVKSCRLEGLMHDFCLSKAQEENFSYAVFPQRSLPSTPSSSKIIRRLAVFLDDNQRQVPGTGTLHVRSCIIHPPAVDNAIVYLDVINSLLEGFKFLRVLNHEHSGRTNNGKLSKSIGKLIHLRYLKLALSRKQTMPSSLGKLIFLQTLDLRGMEGSIPDVLWKLKELIHLYLPRSAQYSSKLRLDGLSKLETLVNFHTDFCDVESLVTLPNLRKLHIGCKVEELAKIIESTMFSKSNSLLQHSNFKIDGAVTQEENCILKQVLAHPHLIKFSLNGHVNNGSSFIEELNTKITNITLIGCGLVDDPMPMLGKMPNLRKLTLRRDSYNGKKMVCLAPNNKTAETSSAGGFPRLIFLWLNGLAISEWVVEEGTMPYLSYLGLYGCNQLKEIPDGLKRISALERLHFAGLNESFKRRILRGGEDYHKLEHVSFIRIVY